MQFRLISENTPKGDQPEAIAQMVAGVNRGERDQVLLGITGSGKTFSVVMALLGGMTGISLLLGGLKYQEQDYNLQGANAYLALIIPLAVIGAGVGAMSGSTSGRNLNLVVIVIGVLRLMLGGGIL